MSSDPIQEVSVAWRVMFGLGAVAIPSILIPSCVLFWKHRNHPVIHNRSIWSVTLTVMAISLFGFFNSLRYVTLRLSCFAVILPMYLTIFHMIFLAERSFLLIAHFKAAIQAKQYAEAKATHLEDGFKFGWFLRHRSMFHHGLFSASKLITYFVCFVQLIVIVALMAMDPVATKSNSETPQCLALYIKELPAINSVLFLACISIGCCVWYLRHVRENFGIRTELKNVGLIIGAGLGFYGIGYLTTNDDYALFANFFFSCMIPFLEVLFSMTLVIVQVRKYDQMVNRKRTHTGENLKLSTEVASSSSMQRKTSSAGPQVDTLREILNDEENCRLLVEFLIQEFAAENVFFLKAVEEYHAAFANTLKSGEDKKLVIADIAKEIYMKYISADSKLSVNIASSCRSQLKDDFSKAESNNTFAEDLFDNAQSEIMVLIAEDSLRRFLRSGAVPNLRSSSAPTAPSQADMDHAVDKIKSGEIVLQTSANV